MSFFNKLKSFFKEKSNQKTEPFHDFVKRINDRPNSEKSSELINSEQTFKKSLINDIQTRKFFEDLEKMAIVENPKIKQKRHYITPEQKKIAYPFIRRNNNLSYRQIHPLLNKKLGTKWCYATVRNMCVKVLKKND